MADTGRIPEQELREALKYRPLEGQQMYERALAALDRLVAERDQARALIVAHHAVGVLDGALVGDTCPVCATGSEPAPAP